MKRIGLSIAIAAALGLSACGGGSSSSSSPEASTSTVSGAASKGIIVGGLVSAYLFDVNGIPETTAVATAITDAKGDYALKVPAAHNGKPLYIVIDDNDGAAIMKCDIAGGCDNDGDGTIDAEFGADLDLAAGELTMSAVLPESAASVSVNITPLTTVAAEVAKVAIQADPTNEFNVQEAISNANSQVAERFGLSGDVTQFEIVDLTDPEEVASTLGDTQGDEAVQYAAINAAIVSAVQSDTANTSINDAIADFAEDYVNVGLIDEAATDSYTDLTEILTEAQAVIQKVEEDIVALGDEFSDAVVEIQMLENDVVADTDTASAGEPEDTGNQGTASPTASATNLAKVKAFVEELRELGTVIDGKIVNEGGADVETILNSFDLQIDAADVASSDDAEVAMEALGRAVAAIVDVYDAKFDTATGLPTTDSQLTTFPADFASVEEGLVVSINKTGSIFTFTVDDNAVEVELEDELGTIATVNADVNVTATMNALTVVDVESGETTEGDTTSENGTLEADVDINITGTVSTTTIDLTVTNGIVKGNLDVVWEETSSGSATVVETSDATFELNGFVFDLDVVLSQKEVGDITDPLTFTGGLEFTVTDLDYIEDEEEQNDFSGTGPDELDKYTYSLDVVGLDITGTFANTTGESFDMAFNLNANATNVPALSETFVNQDKNTTTGGETESAFVAFDASLTFDAELDGLAKAVAFHFDIKRVAYDDVDANLRLSYPGRIITIVADANNLDEEGAGAAVVTLSNNDNVVLTITASEGVDEADDEVVATMGITGDATTYAELAEVNGVDIIRYSDGTFVSAF